MAYAFNDDKSKNHLNGIATIKITSMNRTIGAGESKLMFFGNSQLNTDDILGILEILLINEESSYAKLIICSLVIYDTEEKAGYEMYLYNPTNQDIKLSRKCQIKVRVSA